MITWIAIFSPLYFLVRATCLHAMLSFFQILFFPILTYGSIFWGTNQNYNILYLNNIPNYITSPQELTNYLNIQENSISKNQKNY